VSKTYQIDLTEDEALVLLKCSAMYEGAPAAGLEIAEVGPNGEPKPLDQGVADLLIEAMASIRGKVAAVLPPKLAALAERA
jgi:hypothetical protein